MGRPRSRVKDALPAEGNTTDGRTAEALHASLIESDLRLQRLFESEKLRKVRCECVLVRCELDMSSLDLAGERQQSWELQSDMHRLRMGIENARSESDSSRRAAAALTDEVALLKTQLASSKGASTDSAKVLQEKTALLHELATLKPELESAHARLSIQDQLRDEKYALQEKLEVLEREAVGTKATIKDLRDAQRKRIDQQKGGLAAEVQELKEMLSQSEADLAKAHDEVEAMEEQVASSAHLEAELAKERRARSQAEDGEKALRRAQAAWDAEKAVLDDKLGQFRTKLRSTKESLKSAQAELEATRTSVSTTTEPAQSKGRRKRNAIEPDADAATGTPGHVSKRPRNASSMLGDKSTFSVTPFLNRTSTAIRDSSADEPLQSVESEASPAARPGQNPATKSNVLTPSSLSKSNAQAVRGVVATARASNAPKLLQQVAEEEEENAVVEDVTAKQDVSAAPQQRRPMLKPRKSIAAFASFRDSSVQPEAGPGGDLSRVIKKRRKLLGMSAKTLFDEDGDEGTGVGGGQAVKLVPGGQRMFGAIGGLRRGMGGLLTRGKEPMQVANGFAFSPLKKDRRVAAG